MYYVCILRRANDSFYVGSAQDLDARLKAHNEGRGAAYSSSTAPPFVWSISEAFGYEDGD